MSSGEMQDCINEHIAWVKELTAKGHYRGSNPLEALIASIHCGAPSFAETNWQQIASLYKEPERLVPGSDMVVLNRIIAESYAGAGYDSLLKRLTGTQSLVAKGKGFEWTMTKAHLHLRMGAQTQAVVCLEAALLHAGTNADRQFVMRKIEKLHHSQAKRV